MMTQFSPSALLVLSAVSLTPDITALKRAIAAIDNWDAACDKLIKAGVAGLFLDQVEEYLNISESEESETTLTLPKEVLAKLRQAYIQTITQSVVFLDTYREIASILHKKDIKAVFFRGISCITTLYHKQGLRPLDSIDLLITVDSLPAVVEQLTSNGFTHSKKPTLSGKPDYEPQKMKRNEVSLFIHTHIHPPGIEYRLSAKDMFDRAMPNLTEKPPVYMLELSDLLIDVCTLIHRNLVEPSLKMSGFADLARLLKIHENEINWEKMMGYCWVNDAEYVVMEQLILAHQLFGAPLPPRIKQVYASWVKVETIRQLMDQLNDPQPPAIATHASEKRRWSIKEQLRKIFYKS